MRLIKKAWRVTAKNIIEPRYYEDIIVLVDTIGEAKSKGYIEMTTNYNIQVYEDGDERGIKFTDVVAYRNKGRDKIEYNGKIIPRENIVKEQWIEKRDAYAEDLLETNPDNIALVWNGAYRQYWGDNHSGYSSNIIFAGHYTVAEAYKIVKGSDHSRQEEVRLLDVEDLNSKINAEIERLQEDIDRLKLRMV